MLSGGLGDVVLECSVDDVDLLGTFHFLLQRRVFGDLVTKELKKLRFALLRVLLLHATGRHVIQVLKPFEVRDGDTADVSEQVRNDENASFIKDLVGSESSRTVATF